MPMLKKHRHFGFCGMLILNVNKQLINENFVDTNRGICCNCNNNKVALPLLLKPN